MHVIILFFSIVAGDFMPPSSIQQNIVSQFSLGGTNYLLTKNSKNYNQIYASTNGLKSQCLFYGNGLTSIAVDRFTGNIYYAAEGFFYYFIRYFCVCGVVGITVLRIP